MSEPLSFQEIILRLLSYWQAQGCLVQQPYNVQVGAGTMNPATSLRVLGPEPWNVVYVEPSIRPDDGRFGDNPNRMQMHHQLQVILQPDPGNPQELYLESLEAIGINPREHDIRFVEDNWESPALGAWGLGWEVWLDGQEITQFTYFQQAGGRNLEPVAVEITYGLDRIALALQTVDSVWQLNYGAGLLYGNVLLQSEIEHCRYYFEVADVAAITAVYDLYEQEAQRCLDAGLVVPAHDYNLKCSHLFNILDTRGAVGVTQRADYFHRMRRIARQISDLYRAQREALDYPLKRAWEREPKPPTGPLLQFAQIERPQTFLLEIGCEELPVADLNSAIGQLEQQVPALFDSLRIRYDKMEIYGTPRRLAVVAYLVQGRQEDLEMVAKGPPADRAFDAEGRPTKAALGFARGKGVNVAELTVVEEGDKRYVTAVVKERGMPSAAVLAHALPDLIATLKFTKSMRWNDANVAFSRPIRWLTALYGPDIIPFHYAGLTSGRKTHGLRPYGSPEIVIDDAIYYEAILRGNRILIGLQERKDVIIGVAEKLAAEVKGRIPEDADLLDEVANLVERPTPLRGEFDARFLNLPDEVLVAVMRKHQRYFPVYGEDGALLPYFIAVRNGDEEHLELVKEGNEQVIRARFSDADFFYHNDNKKALADFLPSLAKLTFQVDLGSMLAKVQRLEQLVVTVAEALALSAAEMETAKRAAALSKADLATSLVVEMTSLQGVMGGLYARQSGEPEAVAEAIAEQYKGVSQTKPGLALAISDRLDSLVGLFAAGLSPKGSNDPFALRRAALHIIENLIANQQSLDLRPLLRVAASLMPVTADEVAITAVLNFIGGRLEVVLREQGVSAAVVKAVLAERTHDPYRAQETAVALQSAVRSEGWAELLDSYARCVRITRQLEATHTLRPDAFALDEEKGLYTAYKTAVAVQDGTVPTLVASLTQMQPAITRFFDNVLVMAEDTAVRDNRLALLQHIAHLTQGLADLSELEGF